MNVADNLTPVSVVIELTYPTKYPNPRYLPLPARMLDYCADNVSVMFCDNITFPNFLTILVFKSGILLDDII